MLTLNTSFTNTSLSASHAGNKIRVLVVDDSVVMRQLITRMLASESALEIVGVARNGLDALAKVEQFRPDLVTLDIEMPELDGLGALRLIQQRFPQTRVIMCSSLTERGAAVTIDALLAGADDYVTKQFSGDMSASAFDTLKSDLIAKIRQLFRLGSPPDVKQEKRAASAPEFQCNSTVQISAGLRGRRTAPQILAIGVSTGGPSALAQLMPMIPADFPLPIAIVQHMPPFFTQLLAERLTKLSRIAVFEAKPGMEVKAGQAVLAPGNFHMRVVRKSNGVVTELNQEMQENSCRPAVDVLLRSIAETYGGAAIATILTGMGQDGLLGVRQLKNLGASVIVQDSQTSVVWGMPGAVADAQLADAVLPLQQIVPAILRQL